MATPDMLRQTQNKGSGGVLPLCQSLPLSQTLEENRILPVGDVDGESVGNTGDEVEGVELGAREGAELEAGQVTHIQQNIAQKPQTQPPHKCAPPFAFPKTTHNTCESLKTPAQTGRGTSRGGINAIPN